MKAALITIDLDTGECLHTIFDGENPVKKCWELWGGIKGDWPTHIPKVAADKEAREIWGEWQADRLLGKVPV